MTATPLLPATTRATGSAPPRRAAGERVTQLRVIGSEWTKFRSLRSTWITLGVAVLGVVGIGVLIAGVQSANFAQLSAARRAEFEPIATTLNGVQLGQLAIGVLGVLFVSSEYSTGMIRASLTAVPRRLPVLWAKAGLFAAVTFALMLPATFVAFFVGQRLLDSHGLGTTLSAPGALRSVVGAALYLTVIGLLGIAFGAITRNTAGGIAALFGVLLVLPGIFAALPASWRDAAAKYLPNSAGHTLWWPRPDEVVLRPWVGFAVLCGYAALALGVAALLLRRRDA